MALVCTAGSAKASAMVLESRSAKVWGMASGMVSEMASAYSASAFSASGSRSVAESAMVSAYSASTFSASAIQLAMVSVTVSGSQLVST